MLIDILFCIKCFGFVSVSSSTVRCLGVSKRFGSRLVSYHFAIKIPIIISTMSILSVSFKPIQANPDPLDWVDWTIFLLGLDWIEWIGRIDLYIEFSLYPSNLLQPGSPLPLPKSKIHPIDAAKLANTHLPQLYRLLVAVVGLLVAT